MAYNACLPERRLLPTSENGEIVLAQGRLRETLIYRLAELQITDYGIGMPAGARKAKAGLATNIIQALTSQLQAEVKLSRANTGTIVSVEHMQIAAVRSSGAPAAVTAI